MDISISQAAPTELETPLLVLQRYEGDEGLHGAASEVDARLDGAITRLLERGDFRGARDETALLYPDEGTLGAERVLLVGAGKREDFTLERLRQSVGAAVREAEALRVGDLALSLDHIERAESPPSGADAARAAAEAGVLAAWRFTELKKTAEVEAIPVDALVIAASDGDAESIERAAEHGRITAEAENVARALAIRPGNVATPTHLAEIAGEIADGHGLDLTVLDREAMRREGMHALLAVAQGSEEEPRFIVLEHHGADGDDPPLVLVGKGVTFDAGGISLKPSSKMEEMKYDMGGAAAVIGAMQAVGALDLPVNVVGIVPATENLPSGRAVKPGDVIGSHAGKSIEVINTDAEGRLILADSLSYAQRYEPRAMVDAATLTGSCVVALGHHAVALMGTDESVVEAVRQAGDATGERCWPLPLWDAYRSQLDSDVADIKNTGGRPAGSITAGWFLREFAGDVPWAHLDVAGMAWLDDPPKYLRKGATGIPTRLFVEWVRSHTEQ